VADTPQARPVTSFTATYLDSPRAGRLALLTVDNGADHTKPTVLDTRAFDSLDRALDEIEGQPDVKGVLLTGKPFVFVVGADITQFPGATPEFARQAGARGHAAFRRLAALPVPTVAAINGAAMGGGLELALHCDARTLSSSAAVLAFPEVFLSIVPAWGGTQLVPRVTSAANAIEVVVRRPLNNNQTMRPRDAARFGLVDHTFAAVDLLERSLGVLEDLATGAAAVNRDRPAPDEDLDAVFAQARADVDARVHGATPAPYVALDLLEFAARGGDLDEGYARELDALTRLLPARQAQAAVYAFDLTQQRVKRQPWKPSAAPRPVTRVAVVGAGLMGAQLGALFLQRFEVPLVLKDIDDEVLSTARGVVEGDLDKRVAKGRLDAGRAAFLKSLVTYTADYADLAGADWVIEAVTEVLDLKRRIFADVEAVVDEAAILATNTSSLSVAAMAEGLAHPERVVGFHFFNPVAVMPLLEVVRAPGSSDEAMATAFAVAKRLRKSAVQCADTPAFVVNRVLTRFMAACGEATRRGAGFREVDDAVKALGLPMGTFELIGLVGPGTAAHVNRTLYEAFPDRFPLDENFQALAASGLPGVYDWGSGGAPYPMIEERWERTAGSTPPTAEEIRTAALEAVADEARRMLDDGAVADARDIDTCMLLGAGWPFFNGGVCRYLDQVGISQRVTGGPLVGPRDRALAS